LITLGYLEALPRRGCFVAAREGRGAPPVEKPTEVYWQARMKKHPSKLNHIRKPQNWHDYPCPFIYGQMDRQIFPLNAWRGPSRDTLRRAALDWWSADGAVDIDDFIVSKIGAPWGRGAPRKLSCADALFGGRGAYCGPALVTSDQARIRA